MSQLENAKTEYRVGEDQGCLAHYHLPGVDDVCGTCTCSIPLAICNLR